MQNVGLKKGRSKMINGSTKQKTSIHRATRAISAVVVILAALVAGGFLMASPQAGETAAGLAEVAGGSEQDMGEALMEMEPRERSPGESTRASGWFTCDIHRTGAGWGNIYLRLSSSSFTQRWFRARDDQKKEMLAVGLTALSSNKKVRVYVTGTGPPPYGEIRACYVRK